MTRRSLLKRDALNLHHALACFMLPLAGRRLRRLGRALNGRWSQRAPDLTLVALIGGILERRYSGSALEG